MTLRSGLVFFSYLLSGLGLFCLVLSQAVSLNAGVALLTLLTLMYWLEIKNIIPIAPPTLHLISKWNLLALPVLYFSFDLPLLDLVVWFIAYLMFTRFLLKSELNDYLFGYLLAIVCLLVGALYAQDLSFGVAFLAFYLTLSWCLIFYNLTVEKSGSRSPPHIFKYAGEREIIRAALFKSSTLFTVMSLALTALIFISFPRFGLGFMSLNVKAAPISGFSDKVSLGDVGKIKLNESVVMRVEYFKGDLRYRPQQPVYWRGIVLDHYDGRNWISTLPDEWEIGRPRENAVSLFRVEPQKELVRQEVYRESFDTDIVFTHGIPKNLNGNFRRLRMDSNFVLKTEAHGGPRRFTLHSEIGYPGVAYQLQSPTADAGKRFASYFQLPPVSPAFADSPP